MKVKLLSAVIAASFLAGCSSSGSSDSPSEPAGVASVQTFEGEHFDGMAIQGDNGEYNTVAIRGVEGNTVFNVGGELYFTDGDVVKDASGNVVGNIEVRNNELVFVNDKGFIHLSVDDGRLVVEEVKPKTEHPIEEDVDPGYGGGVVPTYGDIIELEGAAVIVGDNGNHVFISKDETGTINIAVGDSGASYTVNGSEIRNEDGEIVGHTSKEGDNYIVRLEDGTEVVFRNEDGRLFAGVTNRPDISHPIEGVPMHPIELPSPVNPIEPEIGHPIEGPVNLPANELTKEQRAELKQKVQSLSQEQRQQIKRAIRDRVERS
ncbi:conserved exported hypothetical protein [Vibrio harveyi]|uniref:hypothetical protein n=1 Tax=Vibrio harveyi TaxID=669 RepID=UPI001EFEB628|nr:hypothetical protein [Vibrio harveyi]MCG9233061.1 hypothetical protein [Vibrio harveyi]MCG9589055.1 hypothetical protein [Vibrio harveyi]CAH1234091.1 conserved exported hypothetical protein [Vibrio harveyi]CAH1569956.1 conserved exported hypothetical protein [Vibrio harveyi]CAH1580056.1 conserved exported hypothetical protein [Vibrio harveyi]